MCANDDASQCMTSLIISLPFVLLNLEKQKGRVKNKKMGIFQERKELFR